MEASLRCSAVLSGSMGAQRCWPAPAEHGDPVAICILLGGIVGVRGDQESHQLFENLVPLLGVLFHLLFGVASFSPQWLGQPEVFLPASGVLGADSKPGQTLLFRVDEAGYEDAGRSGRAVFHRSVNAA